MVLGVLGGIVGGLFQKSAADSAADAQVQASRDQIAFAEETRDLTRADLAPFYNAGVDSLGQYINALGPAPPRPQDAVNPVKAPWELTAADFEASPGYQFRMDQGLEAVQGGVGARHGLNSGATMQAMNDYAQGQASSEYGDFYNRNSGEYWDNYNRSSAEYGDYMNRLGGLAGSGQNAASGLGAANALASGQVNQAYGNIGNAQAAGAIGGANALSDGIQNAVGSWQFNSLLNGGSSSGGSGFLGGLFG